MNVITTNLFIAALFSINALAYNSYAAGKCRPNTPYYFSEFNPASWKVENELNYEEVYKNFEYFEVFFNRSCDEIAVKKYVKGQLSSSERYKLNPDGSLSLVAE